MIDTPYIISLTIYPIFLAIPSDEEVTILMMNEGF